MVKYDCEYCDEVFTSKHDINDHLLNIHDVDNAKKYHCDHCDEKFRLKSELKKHLLNVHNIDTRKKHKCDYCDKTFLSTSKLKRHLANIHDIGVVWHNCNQCDFKCKDQYNLKKHLAHIHDTGVSWWRCNYENCTLKFKTSSDLKRHEAVHGINAGKFECDLCEQVFNTNPNLTRHYRNVHGIDTVWYDCSECDYRAKSKAGLKSHLARIHSIGAKTYYCDQCEYTAVTKSSITRHKKNVHLINVKWLYCPVKNCVYKAKNNSRLKEHISYIHDIGDKECEYCMLNRYKLNRYKEDKKIVHICNTCLRQITGKESRIEAQMSNYLDDQFGTEFLLASDSVVYGEACQKYRPDKLYASPGIVLHIECDEHQHVYSGNDYSCDEKRISDIYDEFPGQKYIVIRWNPDKYKVPQGKPKLNRAERLEALLACMEETLENPPEEMISIIYMFYDKDNDLISRNIPHRFVYDIDDI